MRSGLGFFSGLVLCLFLCAKPLPLCAEEDSVVGTPTVGASAELQTGELSTAILPTTVAALVDVQRILDESLASKSVQRQIEVQRAKFQSEIAQEEKELRDSETELTKSRESVSAEAYAEQEQQLRQRFLTVEKHVQSRRNALDQSYTDAMNLVRKNFLDIVANLAKEKSFNLVVVKQQVLWSNKNIDITNEVLNRLNKNMPDVEVKLAPVNLDKKTEMQTDKIFELKSDKNPDDQK